MNEELAPFSVCGPQKYLQGAIAITAQQLLKVQKKLQNATRFVVNPLLQP
jgi:hypothetical protein